MGAQEPAAQSADVAAAIDIGSNAVRMDIAQVHPDGHAEVLERMSRPARLGQDTFVGGRLSQDTSAAVIQILRDYRRVLDTYGVELVRAVATSAVREASNRDAFVDRVAMSVGLEVDVIEPAEQSMLIVSAVRHAVSNAVPIHKGTALVVEVGGGSTLVTVLRGGRISASEGYNIGSIRMQEMLATAHESPERASNLLRRHIASTVDLASRWMGLRSVRTFLAIGGDARFAADQAGEPVDGTDLTTVSARRFGELIEQCVPHGPEELVRAYGLAFADAETLVPALLVYSALLDATRAKEMIVSQVSMRDGLLLDLPQFVAGRQDPELAQSILLSAQTLGSKYRYDAEHAGKVAELSVHLFDQLSDLHGLSARHRMLLEVAAVLHDVGAYVSSRAHHKHSYYLIANAEIIGLRRRDALTVAQVARYHRRSMPKRTHLEYAALPRDQRVVINKLAAILRVADALDRAHWQHVAEPEVEQNGRELVIYVEGAGDLTLERRALADKGDLFEEVYGMTVRLEEAAPQP